MQSHFPLIPKQAYLLFPSGKQVCFQQKNLVKRLIFGNGLYPTYTPIENNKIQEFVQLLKNNPTTKDILDEHQKTLLLKMIYAHKYNLEKALENYKDFKLWQKKFIPIHGIDPDYRQKMDNLLKTGVFYCCATRDQYMKPITVVHVGRVLKFKPDQQLFLDAFGYFLQSIIDNMMIDGQLQTWNVIVDVDQTSVFSFAGALFDLIKFLSRIFIGRMYRCYIIDYPFLIKFVWGAVAAMMDAQQNQKCRILTKQQIIQLIPKESLEQKYGGQLPALQNFWPLDSPERLTIQKQNQEKMRKYWMKQNKLVTQEEYYENYKRGQIGNKQCGQIIKKMQKPMIVKVSEPKVIQVIRKAKRLSEQQAMKINERIGRQKKPLSLRIMDWNGRGRDLSTKGMDLGKKQIDLGIKGMDENRKVPSVLVQGKDSDTKTQSVKSWMMNSNEMMQKQMMGNGNNSLLSQCMVRRQVFEQMTYLGSFGVGKGKGK